VALNDLVRAAGGVLRRVGPTGIEVALVHRPRYDDWSLPKGKADVGESDEETAVREVEEETGLRPRLGRELPSTHYTDSRGRPKVVRYWTMTPESGSFEPHGEVDDVRWLPVAEAEEELSYERDVAVLQALSPPLLVIRHGSAGDSDSWPGEDALRPLDVRGRRQAQALVDELAAFDVDRIISSPLARCVEMVEPLARARDVELETSEDLSEGAGPERVRDLILGLDREAVAICGHGPELQPLFRKIKKGETVVVEPTESQLLELGRIRV
jgi:8-oxo-(d)GTP phosphatase